MAPALIVAKNASDSCDSRTIGIDARFRRVFLCVGRANKEELFVPHPFDAANKHILHAHPADWIALGGLPPGFSLEVIDADLSTVSTAADKLIRVNCAIPYVAHLEFQASFDAGLDRRVLVYNVLGRNRFGLPTKSVVFLLRPQAFSPEITGRVIDNSDPDHRLEFTYKLVRVWEIPAGVLLAGGLGTLPLAPIGAVTERELPGVIESMKRRLDSEVSADEARELWTATRILMGLRWSRDVVRQLLRGVQGMRESTTYQEIVREGMEEGIKKGIEQGIEKGIEQGIEKGIEQGIEKGIQSGRLTEARSFLLRRGVKVLGQPDQSIRLQLEAISDPARLEDLTDQLLDASPKSWGELLESA